MSDVKPDFARARALASFHRGELRQSFRLAPTIPDMSVTTIPTKTPLGHEEMRRRTSGLGQRHRTILFLIDGRRPLSEVLSLALKAGAATSHFEDLVRMGFVELPPEEPPVPPPTELPFTPAQAQITELAVEVPAEAEADPAPQVVDSVQPPPPEAPPAAPAVQAAPPPVARVTRAVPTPAASPGPAAPERFDPVTDLPSRPFLPPSRSAPAVPPVVSPAEDLPVLEQARAQLHETLRCDPQPSSARLAERVRLAKGGSELIDVVWVMERGLHHHQRSHRGLLALQRARELLGLGNTLVDEDSRPSRLEDEDW
jgi:hypothetical protein